MHPSLRRTMRVRNGLLCGGKPHTACPKISSWIRSLILKTENQATTSYTERAKEAEAYGDKGLVVQLEDFIRDESSHVEETQRILKDWPL